MAEKITGSLDALSALEVCSMVEGLDAAGRQLLKHKEILAVIARGTIEEYRDYSLKKIMDFIEADSIGSPEVSRGRTNTVIEGVPSDFEELHEKASHFDVAFRARNPRLSTRVTVSLHVNFEVQKDLPAGVSDREERDVLSGAQSGLPAEPGDGKDRLRAAGEVLQRLDLPRPNS